MHRSKISIRHLGSIFGLLCVLHLPARAAGVSFSISMTGTAPGVATGSGESFTPTAFAGTLPPFGTGQGALSLKDLTLTFSLLNGDSITASLVIQPSPNPITTVANGTIIGGTGIFDGATGSFEITLMITNATASGVTFSATGSGTVNAPNLSGGASILPSLLVFQAPQGDAPAAAQVITVTNQGSVELSFTTSVALPPQQHWLSLSSTSGAVQVGGTAAIAVTANPSSLDLGVYEAQIGVNYASVAVVIPVKFIVGNKGGDLELSQTGATFFAVVGGPSPASQTVLVSNTGVGNLSGLTAATSVTGSQTNWLNAAITSGFSSENQTSVAITANPGKLPSGVYYGKVDFKLPSAVNSPQSLSVQMKVDPGPVPTFQPASPIIQLNGDSYSGVYTVPPPVHVIITNPGSATLNYTVTDDPKFGTSFAPWFAFSPPSGVIPPGGTSQITVSMTASCTSNQANLALCAQNSFGACCGLVEVTFPQLNYTYNLWTRLILGGTSSAPTIPSWGSPPPGAPPVFGPLPLPAAAPGACVPTGFEPWFTSVPVWFQATVGQPAPLEAQIVDNCGSNLETGTVIATFGSNDPPVPLKSQGSGLWTATWTPRNTAAASNTLITLQATNTAGLVGTLAWPGTVVSGGATPLVNVGGVSNAASGAHVLAPGSFISIYGANIANGSAEASITPLPTSLASAQVFLAGESLPLQFSGAHQINAVVPYDIPPYSMQQLMVQAGDSLSQPEPVIVAAAAPGVFSQDQSGSGPGAILVQPAGSQESATNTPQNPAHVGDALLIFCTGLGSVAPAVPAGSVAPTSTLVKTVNPVTVIVGGIETPTLFAGLAPGFVALYQVNVTVPSGVPASDAVPVVLTVARTSSPAVTIAVK